MKQFQKLIGSRAIMLCLVMIFLKAFVMPCAILADEKEKKHSSRFISPPVWSSARLNGNEDNKILGTGLSGIIPLNSKNDTKILGNTLFQKSLEDEAVFVKKKKSNKALYIILGLVVVGGGAAAVLIGAGGGDSGPKKGTAVIDIPLPEY